MSSRIAMLILIIGVLVLSPLSTSFADDLAGSGVLTETKITLERGICYGPCPIYKVEIQGTGRIVFTSDKRYPGGEDSTPKYFAYADGVLLPGQHEDQISPEAVRKLVAKFKSAKFTTLKDKYIGGITDMPTYVLTYQEDGETKQVVDYAGSMAGMPAVVSELEEEVDRISGTDRWVSGNTGLVAWLEKQRFDFASSSAGQLAAAAAARDSATEDFVIALVERGAPLASIFEGQKPGRFFGNGRKQTSSVAQAILEGAIATNKPKVFSAVVRLTKPDAIDRQRAAMTFAESGAGCSPDIVDLAFKANIPIDASLPKLPENGAQYPFGQTALYMLATGYGVCGEREADRLPTARELIARGADANHKISSGENALFNVISLKLAKLLLSSGADAKIVDKNGLSALFSVANSGSAFELLKAGASPAGLTEYCENVVQRAEGYSDMAKFVAWMKGHAALWKDKPETNRPCKRPEL